MNSYGSELHPLEALQRLESLVNDISAVWTLATYSDRRIVDSEKLKLGEVGLFTN